VLVFLLPALYDQGAADHSGLGSFSLLIYTHSGHWAAFLAIDQFLLLHHHRSRQQGYLDFYVRTKNIRRAPFYILSVGNAALMLVVVILHDLCDTDSSCRNATTKVDYLRGLITLESLIIICLVVSYIHTLRLHHNSRLPPDVLRQELYTVQAGGHLAPGQMAEVMERQAELIRWEGSEPQDGRRGPGTCRSGRRSSAARCRPSPPSSAARRDSPQTILAEPTGLLSCLPYTMYTIHISFSTIPTQL
jgi:hypothetical protein